MKYSYYLYPDRKLFCPIPFKYMEICPEGETLLCCYITKSPGILKAGNLFDLYNSSAAQRIRKSILDGTFKYCNLEACPHFSAGDLPLQKNCTGTSFENIVKNKITSLDKKSIWISFDQRCNLKCLSCRREILRYSKKDRHRVDEMLQIVKDNLSHLDQIGLCGSGEPFASSSLRNFLENLNTSEYPQLKISILSNGLLFDRQAWNSMAKCHSSIKSIQISIDAASKENYEKIRIGGSFEKLMENLQFISHLRREEQIEEFIISFVVNSINFSEMDSFVNMGIDLLCDQVYFSYMNKCESMSKAEYEKLAIHLPTHEQHRAFRIKLKNPVFDNPVVLLGNVKRFKNPPLLRDSLFS